MTKKEIELLELFRNLNKGEQDIIVGKISELVLNKKKERLVFSII